MNLYRQRHPISAATSHKVTVPGHARPLDVSSIAPPGPPWNYSITGLVTSQLNISFAASLDFPAVFSSSLKGDMFFYLLDLVATLPEMPVDQGEFTGVVYGVGIRVGIATTKIESKLASSIAGVAANAELSVSTTNCSFTAPGLGTDIIPKAGPFFTNPGGAFNAQKVQELGQGLQAISSYLIENARTLAPTPVYVLAETPQAQLSKVQAISASWAINRIEEGKSYDQAFSEIHRDNPLEVMIDNLFVQAIYQRIVNNAGSDKPSEQQRQLARSIRDLKGAFA